MHFDLLALFDFDTEVMMGTTVTRTKLQTSTNTPQMLCSLCKAEPAAPPSAARRLHHEGQRLRGHALGFLEMCWVTPRGVMGVCIPCTHFFLGGVFEVGGIVGRFGGLHVLKSPVGTSLSPPLAPCASQISQTREP